MAQPTLLDIMKRNAGDAAVGLIDETTKNTPEVRLGAARTISGTSYDTTVRISLPVAGFRGVNEGVVASKSEYADRTVGTFILNPRWECDKALADASEDGALSYIYEEAEAITSAAFQALGKQFYYGAKYGGQAKGHPGLRDFVDSAMIIDAGGTSEEGCTTVWAVRFGRKDVRWVLGKDGEVKTGDPWIESLVDKNGNKYTGYVQEILARVGLQVGSRFSIACIKNLTAEDGKGLDDDRMYDLIEAFKEPPDMFFMTKRSRKRYRREKNVAELGELDVGVFRFGESPTPDEDASGDRGGDEIEYTIEVAVRKKAKTDEEIEALVKLCEEIRSFLARRYLDTVAGDVIGSGAGLDPIYDEAHLTKGIFFGLVTATFRGFEE